MCRYEVPGELTQVNVARPYPLLCCHDANCIGWMMSDTTAKPNMSVLERGFRPFFLVAALWSVAAMAIWIVALATGMDVPGLYGPVAWHAHEMIFGYAAAVIAGFLLTAIPNWTGRLPVRGTPLALLAAIWLIGRLAILASEAIGATAAALIDLGFPCVFLAIVLREIVAGRNLRNAPVALLLTVLALANGLFHLDALGWLPTEALALRLGIAAIAILIALIGGRVTPSFTRNWLIKQGLPVRPAEMGWVDKASMAVTGLALVAWVGLGDHVAAGLLLLLAGLVTGLRLSRWQSHWTGTEPLVWVLHLGYGWLAAGLFATGLAICWDEIPISAGLHALTAGAIGTMTLALMTRASLGHSNRALRADAATTAIYGFVTAAALCRVVGPFIEPLSAYVFEASALFWLLAYGLFLVSYGPLLLNWKR